MLGHFGGIDMVWMVRNRCSPGKHIDMAFSHAWQAIQGTHHTG
jgi:hypothetical protein